MAINIDQEEKCFAIQGYLIIKILSSAAATRDNYWKRLVRREPLAYAIVADTAVGRSRRSEYFTSEAKL